MNRETESFLISLLALSPLIIIAFGFNWILFFLLILEHFIQIKLIAAILAIFVVVLEFILVFFITYLIFKDE